MLGPAFTEALGYAAEVHADQERKGDGGTPYIGHLLSVTGLVIEAGGSEAQAIGALLHDAAEDQGGEQRLADIEGRFGVDVARIVRDCSDTLDSPKPLWRTRKEQYLAHLEEVAAESLLVSLADKVDNARAMLRDHRAIGDRLWERFAVSDPQQQLWYYRSLAEVFARRCDSPLAGELVRVVAELEESALTPPA